MSTISIGSTNVLSAFKGTTAIKSVYRGAVKLLDFFSPLSLFANGEQGVWYEPSTTTAFRSTTDLTPCDYGQSAGLLLDLSKGAGYSGGSFTGLGSELVENGDFSDGTTGWSESTNVTFSVVGGVAQVTAGDTNIQRIYQALPTTPNAYYLWEFDYDKNNTNRLWITAGTSPGGSQSYFAEIFGGASRRSVLVKATTSTTYFSLGVYGIGSTGMFDNVSVRELPGNHATQTTLASRPILARVPETGRRNLLPTTNDITVSPWQGAGATAVLAPSEPDPYGETGEVTRVTGASSFKAWYLFFNFTSGTQYTLSAWVKSGTGSDQTFTLFGDNSQASPDKTATSSWQRFEFTFTASSTASREVGISDGLSSANYEVLVYGAQLELGSTATAYQKVVDQYNITEAGVTSLEYLAFDGTDDGMATASIDFTATDKMSVFAGVEKESDAVAGVVAELSANVNLNNGAFGLFAPANTATGDYRYSSRGTTLVFPTSANAFSAPIANALTGLSDISAPSATLRVDGTQVDQVTSTQGTGNFGNYPLYIGRRGGTTLPFDGHLYGLIVRGAASDATEISNTEIYLGARSGFSAPTITGVPTIGVS